MSKQLAKEVLNHLEKTNQAFCFVDGVIVSREMCLEVLA